MKYNKLVKYSIITVFMFIVFTNTIFGVNLSVNNLQELENVIKNELYNRNPHFTINYDGSNDNLENSLNNIINSDAYLSNSINSYMWSYEGYNYNFEVEINATHIVSYKEELKSNEKIDSVLNEIISQNMNVHEKIKSINDWIVLNGKYDTTLINNSHYDLLFEGNSICNGYALLTYKMLSKLNIPVKLIVGYGNSGPHIWNMLKIDDYWFHLDTTFNDPVPDNEGVVSYDYFLLSDNEIKKDHSFEDNYPIAEKSYFEYLLELSESSKDSYKYSELIKQINLDVYLKENTIHSLNEFKNILSKKSLHEPLKISIRCLNDVVEDSINLGLKTLYNNKNVNKIEYILKNDKTDNYKILDIFLTYKQEPLNITSSIIKTIYTIDQVVPFKITANYSTFDKDITSLVNLSPYNKDILSIDDGYLNFNNIGKTLLHFDYNNKNLSIPITVFNNKGLEYVLNEAPIDDIKVKIFDKYINFDQPPIIENGRTLVPIRAIFEVLGLDVSWNAEDKIATGNNDKIQITIPINNKTVYVNKIPVILDVPAKIFNKRTLVPIRFISEALGRDVDWDNLSRTVIIN